MFELSVQGRVRRTLELEPGDIEGCVNQALREVSPLCTRKSCGFYPESSRRNRRCL